MEGIESFVKLFIGKYKALIEIAAFDIEHIKCWVGIDEW
jgi:hypothetical protein